MKAPQTQRKYTTIAEEVAIFKLNDTNEVASLGYLASSVVHDLETPLTTVLLNLELLQEALAFEETKCLTRALSGAQKMRGLISNFKNQLQTQINIDELNIQNEIYEALGFFETKDETVKVKVSCQGLPTININKTKFSQLLTNLISNAIHAVENSGKKRKTIAIKTQRTKEKFILSIKDNGNGITKANLKKIFEPMYTTKKEYGLGLGLYICREIIETEYGGKITVKSKPSNGTAFTVIIPHI